MGKYGGVRRPELTVAAVCSGWGTIPLLVRQVDLPAQAIVFSRLSIAAVGLAAAHPLLRDRRTSPFSTTAGDVENGEQSPRGRAGLVGPAALAAAILAVHWVCLVAAYQRAASGTVILIVYLAPVGIAALEPRTLGQRHSGRTLAALATALAGFVLVAAPQLGRSSAAGLALALAAAVTFVALVLVSKPLAEAHGGHTLALIEMTGAALVLAPVAALTGWGAPQPEWLWLVVLGLVHTALGTALYLGALARTSATVVGILGYLEPAAVVLLGWLFLNEPPGPSTLVGGVLIVVAGWLTVTGPQAATVEVPTRVPR